MRLGKGWRVRVLPSGLDRGVESVDLALARVDEWLCGSLRHLEPLSGNAPQEYLFRSKCFNEMAFYLVWRERFPASGLERLEPLREHLLSRIGGEFLGLAARDPGRILVFALSVSFALRCRSLSCSDAALARYVLSAGFAWNTERLPCHQLDVLLACAIAGIEAPVAPSDVARVSSLAIVPSPLHADRESFYSFTHSVYYGYLLGLHDIVDSARLHAFIEGGLCRTIAADDLDLGLELVAAAQLAGLRDSPGQRRLIRWAVETIARDGALATAPSLAESSFSRECPTEARWAEKSHTTFAAGLALSAVAHFSTESGTSSPRCEGNGVESLGAALGALQKRRWIEAFKSIRMLEADLLEHPIHRRLVADLLAFIESHDRESLFVGFVEERKVYDRLKPGGAFDTEIREPIARMASDARDTLRRLLE